MFVVYCLPLRSTGSTITLVSKLKIHIHIFGYSFKQIAFLNEQLAQYFLLYTSIGVCCIVTISGLIIIFLDDMLPVNSVFRMTHQNIP